MIKIILICVQVSVHHRHQQQQQQQRQQLTTTQMNIFRIFRSFLCVCVCAVASEMKLFVIIFYLKHSTDSVGLITENHTNLLAEINREIKKNEKYCLFVLIHCSKVRIETDVGM